MRKNTHFNEQQLYGQVIKMLDKSKVLHIKTPGSMNRSRSFFYE